MRQRKIINDPLYGFVQISEEIIFDLIEHPYFQRLRRIKQLGLTHLVYPGALHTRFHHAIGAMHLMKRALNTLISKGVEITHDEKTGALIAILLHDIGHGPFSHSLEKALIQDVSHEELSKVLMEKLNVEFDGKLTLAIQIFNNEYKHHFLHDLVSSQLDVDRLDYLRRDSFYTGVSEGIVGLERIIEMMSVSNDELVIESKGLYSVEKFIIARRMMYWQVYLHKTAIAVDQLLLAILKRAKWLSAKGDQLFGSQAILYFLNHSSHDVNDVDFLKHFTHLDDIDFEASMKEWANHSDPVLARLCDNLIQRKLPKIKLSKEPITQNALSEARMAFISKNGGKFDGDVVDYFVYTGEVKNEAYQAESNSIQVLNKDGLLQELTMATDNYNLHALEETVTKYFICFPK